MMRSSTGCHRSAPSARKVHDDAFGHHADVRTGHPQTAGATTSSSDPLVGTFILFSSFTFTAISHIFALSNECEPIVINSSQ